ncbi:MAG: hypothetical protein AAB289_07970 [Chloroflexota bacterium]
MPTATICTEEFGSLARAEAEALGIPGLPTPIVPHPMGGLRAGEVRAVADQAIASIEYVLVTPAEVLDREFRGFLPGPRSAFRAKPLFV